MTAQTLVLPGGRLATVIPADDAGEVVLSCADGWIMHLEATGQLSWRQIVAAQKMAELYGKGGFSSPWRRTGGGSRCGEPCPDNGKCECVVAHCRREFDDLMEAAPRHCQAALKTLMQGDGWPQTYDPRPLWREGLSAVADRLKLAPEEN